MAIQRSGSTEEVLPLSPVGPLHPAHAHAQLVPVPHSKLAATRLLTLRELSCVIEINISVCRQLKNCVKVTHMLMWSAAYHHSVRPGERNQPSERQDFCNRRSGRLCSAAPGRRQMQALRLREGFPPCRDLRRATCIFITSGGYEWPSTGSPMQNQVRVMLNPYDNDSGCIPPSFITTLSLTPLASHVL